MAGYEDAYPQRNSQPEVREDLVRAVGGSSAVTKTYGPGVTVTRTGTGAYRFAWDKNPGIYLGSVLSLSAATPGDLAGHTVIADSWDSTNLRLDLVVYNASDTAHDLAASEWVTVKAMFTTDPNPR